MTFFHCNFRIAYNSCDTNLRYYYLEIKIKELKKVKKKIENRIELVTLELSLD